MKPYNWEVWYQSHTPENHHDWPPVTHHYRIYCVGVRSDVVMGEDVTWDVHEVVRRGGSELEQVWGYYCGN